MQFPLLRPRRRDRTFTESDPFSLTQLDIPTARGGRVRLQMTIRSLHGSTEIALVIEWPRRSPPPGTQGVAVEVWRALTTKPPRRTQRAGLVAFELARGGWRGTAFVRKADAPELGGIEAWYAILCIREALAFAYRHLRGRWPNDRDKQLWMYRMHRYTALVVADEVAKLYLSDDRNELVQPEDLERVEATLRERIEAVWGPTAGRTPRRLALALVDAKFKDVLPELLHPGRVMGIGDSQLWSRLLPPEKAQRVQALCPTPAVRDLRRYSRWAPSEDYAASWFLRWWVELVHLPLHPFEMRAAGDDTWPSYVWAALHS